MSRTPLFIAAAILGVACFSSTAHAATGTGTGGVPEGPMPETSRSFEIDDLDHKGERRMRAGKWTMIAGAAGASVGTVLFGAGFGAMGKCMETFWEAEDSKWCDHDANLMGTGVLFVGAGLVTVVAGGITYGVGKNKQRRARRARAFARVQPGFSAGPSGVASSLTLRF